MQRFLVSLAIMLAVFTARTSSHHSIAKFDNLNPTTLTGTVKEFIWVNPHGHLVIDVKERWNGKGELESTTREETACSTTASSARRQDELEQRG